MRQPFASRASVRPFFLPQILRQFSMTSYKAVETPADAASASEVQDCLFGQGIDDLEE